MNHHEISSNVAAVRLESLQKVSLALAEERSPDVLLQRLVQGLVDEGVALARVWLLDRGDICQACPMRDECPDQTRCLHLVASAGRSKDGGEDWSRLSGSFRRIPLGARKVGHVGATGSSVLIRDLAQEQHWKPNADWVLHETIRSFAGHPLVFRGELLGVLGVFSRAPLDDDAFEWLRVFAGHAAVSIANARAFVEIERLRSKLEIENAYLREEIKGTLAPSDIIGNSLAIQRVLQQIEVVAPTDANVLVLGESGTGKELVARRIHEQSQRRERPLITVNCASIPRELFESEFFGHAKGAFTGALRDRAGRFQAADGGTLFLDEIGEIPLELQSKLLRAIQEGQFERVGEERTRRIDVRIVAATNRDLPHEVAQGRFRQDLYYRLSVFPVHVPPLRERLEDIAELAACFVGRSAKRIRMRPASIGRQQLEALRRYPWPGNIRELQNVIERAVILSRGGGPLQFDLALPAGAAGMSARNERAEAVEGFVTAREFRERERQNLLGALVAAGWRIYGRDGAAARLGIKPTTLASRMKTLGIARPGSPSAGRG
ncbi:MAG TPA: sigma 54-interacting transcriptional regulator [Vicinamibacteria bacterium]|nr:sigma 54-interacting transcriptional regulator [Vicinamibacteria bacterium]